MAEFQDCGPAEKQDAVRVRGMRDHLLGLWAARELGFGGGNALAYASEVTATDAEQGEAAMVNKIVADLAHEGIAVDRDTVAARLCACERDARTRLAQPPY